jgi:hypothetical protein
MPEWLMLYWLLTVMKPPAGDDTPPTVITSD